MRQWMIERRGRLRTVEPPPVPHTKAAYGGPRSGGYGEDHVVRLLVVRTPGFQAGSGGHGGRGRSVKVLPVIVRDRLQPTMPASFVMLP